MKKIVQGIFLLLALLPWLVWKCIHALGDRENSIQGVSQFLALFPGKFGSLLRAAFYRMALKNCSQDSVIEFLTTFSHSGASFGKHYYDGIVANIGWFEAGENIRIGAYAYVASGRNQPIFDDPETPIRMQGGERVKIRLGRDCWVGVGSCVYADVGEGCIVSPHSVVVKPVPPFSIVGGNPARVMGKREKSS